MSMLTNVVMYTMQTRAFWKILKIWDLVDVVNVIYIYIKFTLLVYLISVRFLFVDLISSWYP